MEFFKATVDSVEKEEVKIGDTKGTFIQWLVTKAQGSESYALRRFIMKPGGIITCHNHKYVETVYLLKGKLEVTAGNQKVLLEKDSYVFINKFVPHELKNIGSDEVIFLCAISYEDDMTIKALEKCSED